MHEPARRGGFALVEAFSVKPEAVTAGVLDEVIIARRFNRSVPVVITPPFAGDAFRTLGARNLISHAAPAKTPRRPVGNERHDFSRLGPRQQQKRARVFLGGLCSGGYFEFREI